VKQQLRQFIIENFLFGLDDNSFTDDDSFLEKGFIDSTGVLELVAFLEQNYGIKVQDDELVPENLDSIEGLHRYLERKMYTTEANFAGRGVPGR
jgi:acyl carrier protein